MTKISQQNKYQTPKLNKKVFKALFLTITAIFVSTILVIIFFMFHKPVDRNKAKTSIAVLPFFNNNNDSNNKHIINGIMESLLTNLQSIENLKVISRTSAEKYRNHKKSIPEIAKELKVKYIVEGSGQRIGNQIMLNIQLIDGKTNKHIWSKQYNRELKEIFSLQNEITQIIAKNIQVTISPEIEKRFENIPTRNLAAYDHFLKGLDLARNNNRENLERSLPHFEKAIKEDETFARAYAELAIAYYFLDIFQTEKSYTDKIASNADKALLYAPKLAQSQMAKSLSCIITGDFVSAEPFLRKALEYKPGSPLVITVLADFYSNCLPNTEKYLEYALKGLSINIAGNDSVSMSYMYFHISNALIKKGFVDEAMEYINKSVAYKTDNLYSEYLKAYINYAKDKDLKKTKILLLETLQKAPSRIDIIQEIAKICYYMQDFQEAYKYYNWFLSLKNEQKIDVYLYENIKMAYVYSKMGYENTAQELLDGYKNYADNDKSIYKNLSLSMYYAYTGNKEKSLEKLEIFSKEKNFNYWVILFLDKEPLFEDLKETTRFKDALFMLKLNFWDNNNKIKKRLEAKKLI